MSSGHPLRRASDRIDADVVFAGGGDMGALMRSLDWGATPLGAVQTWPQSLRTAVSILLNSRYPMFVFWGPELVKIYNDAYRPITGAKHPWAMGRRGREVWPEIWDTIGPMVEGIIERGESTWSDDLMLFMERNGFREEVYFTFSYSPIRDESGGVGGMFCACTETTQKVLGERRLRSLRDLAARPVQAATVDEACRLSCEVLATNPADLPFSLLYLLDDQGGSPRLVATSGVGAEPPEPSAWPLQQVASTGQPQIVTDLPLPMPAGPWPEPPHTAMVLPLLAPGHECPAGVLVLGVGSRRTFDEPYRDFLTLVANQVATNVAKVRALEDERRRAESLAAIDRAKTSFFSNVSHEFRTPLTLMLGPSDDLLAGTFGALSEPARQQVLVIHRNTLRLQRLVNALLEFSRSEAGRLRADYQRTDLATLTRDLASGFRGAVERAGLAFVVDCEPQGDDVYVDRSMWERIVLNLLSNALKFTFEGAITVRLAQRGFAIELSVSDTGVGIPADELSRVFDRFHRVQGARSRTHEGSGIGLATVRELVGLHGGTVAVESTVGGGTTFKVTLRAGRDHLPASQIVAEGTSPVRGDGDLFVDEAIRWLPPADTSTRLPDGAERPLVLVADDNADMREYLERLLAGRFSVLTASDGAEAVDLARRSKPDLILTDVMMPRLDGFGVLAAARSDDDLRGTPVVMLSARAGEESRIEGLEAGADDYLVKPFSSKELLARVQLNLDLSRLRRESERARARLTSVFMQAPVAVAVLTGPRQIFELANERYVELSGGRDLLGKSLREAYPELPSDSSVFAVIDRVFQTGVPFVAEEYPVALRRDGVMKEAFFRFVSQPIRGNAREVTDVITVASEVTEQVLARRNREQAIRFRELTAGIIGHDLRNPLSAITTAAGLVETRTSDAQILLPIGRILSSAGRMERMITQLLDFTRVRLGSGIPVKRERADLRELVDATVEELLTVATKADIRVRAEGDVVGHWDRDRLLQLLSNIVGNACQHGVAGTPVAVQLDGRASDVVRVAVHNQGVVDAELLPTIFEPLREARPRDGSLKGSSGLGLGLFISREIARAHGGTIEVASLEREGTTFIVTVPRVGTDAAEQVGS